MMPVLLIGFGVMAFFHWLYEDVIAPSLRDWLRYQLFDLRDQLRMLKVVQKDGLRDDLYAYIQRSLNNTIKYMRLLNVSFIWKADEIAREISMNPVIARNEALLAECDIKEIQAIRERQRDIIGYAILVNMGGLLIYLVPVVVMWQFFGHMKDIAKQTFYMPEQEVLRLMTDSPVPETRIIHA